jgi:dTDP-4-amino-4,6-dideoxygalactose transaminase
MAGTKLDGKQVGIEADAAVFSFHAVKNLPTADAGMVCFANADHDEMARKLSWMGITKDTYTRANGNSAYKWRYDVDYVGYKYNGNSIMAAIALAQLPYLDSENAYRRQLSAWYDSYFSDTCEVQLPAIGPGCEPSRHLYQILVANRDEVLLALNREDIYPGVHYRDNTEYPMYRYAYGTCPVAHEKSLKLISLPLHLRMSRHDIDVVASAVLRYAKKGGRQDG